MPRSSTELPSLTVSSRVPAGRLSVTVTSAWFVEPSYLSNVTCEGLTALSEELLTTMPMAALVPSSKLSSAV